MKKTASVHSSSSKSKAEFSGHESRVTSFHEDVIDDCEYFKQQLDVDNERIADLEAVVQKYQMLQKTMEQEMEELRNAVQDREQQITELEGIISGFMSVCESTSPEDAIEEIRQSKKELIRLRKLEEVDADQKFEAIASHRQKQIEGIYERLEEHGKNIHDALQDLKQNVGDHGEDSITIDMCRNLENANQLLASRLRQLNSGNDPDYQTPEYRPPRYESRGLGPALWMANKRDLLSLERQMLTVTRKLENAQRSCQFLTQENMRLLGHGCCRQSVTGTLL